MDLSAYPTFQRQPQCSIPFVVIPHRLELSEEYFRVRAINSIFRKHFYSVRFAIPINSVSAIGRTRYGISFLWLLLITRLSGFHFWVALIVWLNDRLSVWDHSFNDVHYTHHRINKPCIMEPHAANKIWHNLDKLEIPHYITASNKKDGPLHEIAE